MCLYLDVCEVHLILVNGGVFPLLLKRSEMKNTTSDSLGEVQGNIKLKNISLLPFSVPTSPCYPNQSDRPHEITPPKRR